MQATLIDYTEANRFIVVETDTFRDNSVYIRDLNKEYMISNTDIIKNSHEGDVFFITNSGRIRRVYESNTRSIDLMMTIHCNSNCIMCPISESARQSKEDGYYEYLSALIDALPQSVEHICITGGEPTLLGDKLFYIINLLTRKFPNAEYQLLTNGRSCANKAFCERIVKSLPDCTLYGVPLHAGNSELYDSIVQVHQGFEQVVQGIRNLVRCGANVEIRVVVSKQNALYMDELAEFILHNFWGIYCVTFMGIETMGNALKNLDAIWIEYEVATGTFENAMNMLVENGIDVMIYNYPLCCIDKKYWMLARRSITPYKVRYYEVCNQCEVKDRCSGFFQSTFKVVNTKIKPVKMYD